LQQRSFKFCALCHKNDGRAALFVITVSTPSVVLVIIYYIFILFLFWYKPKYKVKLNLKYCVLAGAVSVALIAVSFLWPKGMEVVFLDVGQGDGALSEHAAARLF